MEARYYQKLGGNKVKCTLCPNNCIIQEGKAGLCRIRENRNGSLIASVFGQYSAIAFDPIEKKPLYHFYPGSQILSLGTIGCNLHCAWCQNCEISQKGPDTFFRGLQQENPEDLLKLSLENPDNIGVAFTYNEPGISIESNAEVARLFKENGLKTVLVSNAYLNPEALAEYAQLIDAFNVDLKAFDEANYKKNTGGSFDIVRRNILSLLNAGKHVEITCLIVPGVNDNEQDFRLFLGWFVSNCGKDIAIHLSRYFPHFKMNVAPTPAKLLENFAQIASEHVHYVYVGNMYSEKYTNTHCPECGEILIERKAYQVKKYQDLKSGFCKKCGTKLIFSENLV